MEKLNNKWDALLLKLQKDIAEDIKDGNIKDVIAGAKDVVGNVKDVSNTTSFYAIYGCSMRMSSIFN